MGRAGWSWKGSSHVPSGKPTLRVLPRVFPEPRAVTAVGVVCGQEAERPVPAHPSPLPLCLQWTTACSRT